MSILHRLLVDFVVLLHLAYVLSVVLGLVAILTGKLRNWEWVRNRWFRGVHLAMIVVVVLESWCGITCPLTTWENELRSLAGQSTHRGAFIADMVHHLMFFRAKPWVFTVCYTLFGAIVVASLYLVPPRWRVPSRPFDAHALGSTDAHRD